MASFPPFHRPFLPFPFTHVPSSSIFFPFFLPFLFLCLLSFFPLPSFIERRERTATHANVLNYLNWHLSMVSLSPSLPPPFPSVRASFALYKLSGRNKSRGTVQRTIRRSPPRIDSSFVYFPRRTLPGSGPQRVYIGDMHTSGRYRSNRLRLVLL